MIGQMILVQMFQSLNDHHGRALPPDIFLKIFHELAEKFGGVTAYRRFPATGAWKEGSEGQL